MSGMVTVCRYCFERDSSCHEPLRIVRPGDLVELLCPNCGAVVGEFWDLGEMDLEELRSVGEPSPGFEIFE